MYLLFLKVIMLRIAAFSLILSDPYSLSELGALGRRMETPETCFSLHLQGGPDQWVQALGPCEVHFRGEDFLIPWVVASDQRQLCHVIPGTDLSDLCPRACFLGSHRLTLGEDGKGQLGFSVPL